MKFDLPIKLWFLFLTFYQKKDKKRQIHCKDCQFMHLHNGSKINFEKLVKKSIAML